MMDGSSAKVYAVSSLLLTVLSAASCTGYQLRAYRDDHLVENYSYTLGEQYIRVDGMNLCYQEMGEGETILILPGLGTSIDYWQLNIPALAEHYHVVALDYPGFGKSDKPDVAYELPWIVKEIFAFMDAKGIERTAVIGGSLGGHLGLLMALERPDRVSKLVLMGSVGIWQPPNFPMDVALRTLWRDSAFIEITRSRWPEFHAKLFRHGTPLTARLFLHAMAVRANYRQYFPQGRAASRAFRNIFYASCRDRLDEVRCPVLLIWGEEDEIHPAKDLGMYFRSHLPDARLVVVPDAAHEVMMDRPEVFNDLVIRFVASGTEAIEDRLPSNKVRKR
ncbi:MAG: alpha/beta fold hydrolase [Planctomycetota bacterium]